MEQQRDELATKRDLDKVEQKLTGRIDQVEQNLTGRIDQVDQRLTDKIDENGTKLDENGRKLDTLLIQVIENGEQLSKMLTKEEFHRGCDEILRGLDKMMTILTRLDQERVATTARLDRIENDVERIKAKLA